MTSNSTGRYTADEPAELDEDAKIARPRLGVTNQALIVGVMAAIAGWFLHVLSERNERDAALPPIPKRLDDSALPTIVTVAPSSIRSISQTIDMIGTLNCFEEIPISAKVDGTILNLHCDVSTRVPAGELLIEIDPESYELDVKQAQRSLEVDLAKLGLHMLPPADWDIQATPSVVQAQARFNLAENRLQRLRKLAADNAASDADLDAAISEFSTGKAERDSQILAANASLATIQMKQTALEIAQRKLKDTRIVAPAPSRELPISVSAGAPPSLFVVSERMVSEGAYVRSGTQVLKLVIDAKLKLKASVPEKFSSVIALGQQASISTAAQTAAIAGFVTNIYPTVDPTNRTFEIEIQVDNQDRRLMPGNFAKASVQIGQRDNATTVPLESIVSTAGMNKVFVLEDGKAREYQVRLGTQSNEWVEILDPPFPANVSVLTSGHAQLSSGSLVQVRDAPKNSSANSIDRPTPSSLGADGVNPQP